MDSNGQCAKPKLNAANATQIDTAADAISKKVAAPSANPLPAQALTPVVKFHFTKEALALLELISRSMVKQDYGRTSKNNGDNE